MSGHFYTSPYSLTEMIERTGLQITLSLNQSFKNTSTNAYIRPDIRTLTT